MSEGILGEQEVWFFHKRRDQGTDTRGLLESVQRILIS